jgi:arginine N-succinyltransferase
MDMSYEEADKLSRRNKEFIRGLFPEGTIYASLLPQQAQDVIGKVGAQTRGVEKLLRRIGFRYAERVDPFDGGPHFTALTDEITLVQDTQHLNVRGVLDANQKTGKRGLVAVENAEAPWFRAVLSAIELGEDEVKIGEHEARMLGVHPGDAVWVLPLD